MKAEVLIYTIRPDRTALWLPDWLARRLGIDDGAELTREQYEGSAIQELIGDRKTAQAKPQQTIL